MQGDLGYERAAGTCSADNCINCELDRGNLLPNPLLQVNEAGLRFYMSIKFCDMPCCMLYNMRFLRTLPIPISICPTRNFARLHNIQCPFQSLIF